LTPLPLFRHPKVRYRPFKVLKEEGIDGGPRAPIDPSVATGDAASRAALQVCHTCQGQDKRAPTAPRHHLRGLDMAWPWSSSPHRESGTRFGLRQTLDRQTRQGGWLTIGRKDDSGTAWATPLGWVPSSPAPCRSYVGDDPLTVPRTAARSRSGRGGSAARAGHSGTRRSGSGGRSGRSSRE